MVKVAWKVINGFGPYAYLQKSVKKPDGTVVSEHVAYLGGFGKAGLVPSHHVTFKGERILIPSVGQETIDALGDSAIVKVDSIETQVSAGVPLKDIKAVKVSKKAAFAVAATKKTSGAQVAEILSKADAKQAEIAKQAATPVPGVTDKSTIDAAKAKNSELIALNKGLDDFPMGTAFSIKSGTLSGTWTKQTAAGALQFGGGFWQESGGNSMSGNAFVDKNLMDEVAATLDV